LDRALRSIKPTPAVQGWHVAFKRLLLDRALSEDIDIAVFREDIGQPVTFEELEAMSGKKRNARLETITAACQEYIHGPMLERLSVLLQQTLKTANLNPHRARVEPDPDDPDRQSLLLRSPTETAEGKPSSLHMNHFILILQNAHIADARGRE